MQGFDEPCGVLPRMWGSREYKFPGLFLNTGNRCGHDPLKLAVNRLDLHVPKGGHWPALIQAAIKRIQAYFLNPHALSPLAHLSKKTNQDGSPRQNRSEAREAHALVSSSIFTHLDLKSLRVGNYAANGTFISTTFLEMARECSMTRMVKARDDQGQVIPGKEKEVPTSRFWGAIRDLKKAGAISVFEQYEEKDAGKRALSAIKTFNAKFLQFLTGWTPKRIEKARSRASGRVAAFQLDAVEAGTENVHQRKALAKDIERANFKRELFGAPTSKNRTPSLGGSRKSIEDMIDHEYAELEARVLISITESLGRAPRGFEQMKLQSQHGWISKAEFERRRLGG